MGDNPERLCSEASFAALCGVSPVEHSSGRQRRHRLNRGGDRQANAALHRIVQTRLRFDAHGREGPDVAGQSVEFGAVPPDGLKLDLLGLGEGVRAPEDPSCDRSGRGRPGGHRPW
ncbi:transposase [Streptomyces tubercidicus]